MEEWEIQYKRDFARLSESGQIVFTEKQKLKNLELRDAVRDLLPIDDDHKISDCDLIYRFLIGQKWDCKTAQARLRAYVQFRKEERINGILNECPPPILTSMLSVIYGVDVNGYPVVWIAPDHAILMSVLNSFQKKVLLRAQIQVMERGRFLAKALGVDRCLYVINFKKITLSSVNSTILGFLKSMNIILQALYPEIMSKILVYNSGWVVANAWRVLKPLVDARVQEKVIFFNLPPSVKTLRDFVEPDQVLPEFGGTGKTDPMGERLQREEHRLREAASMSTYDGKGTPRLFKTNSARLGDSARQQPHLSPLNGNRVGTEDHTLREGIRTVDSSTPTTREISNSSTDGCESFVNNSSFCSCISDAGENNDGERAEDGRPDNHDRPHHPGGPRPFLPFDLNSSVEETTFVGYYENQCIGIFRRGQIYCQGEWPTSNLLETTSNTHDGILQLSKANASSSTVWNNLPKTLSLKLESLESGLSTEGWVFGGELLRESRHPIHRHVILCDAMRKARFVLRKSILRRRLTIYQIVGNSSVQTNSSQEHSVEGKHVKVAVVVPPPSSSSSDPTRWIILNKNNMDPNNVCANNKSSGGMFSKWFSPKKPSSRASSNSKDEDISSPTNPVGSPNMNPERNEKYKGESGSKVIGFYEKDIALFQGPLASISLPISFLMMVSITLMWGNMKNIEEGSSKT
ncbi:unnamed protein product [Phytomonas sp. Hart1]|nr:unnamed protein product [Phytomonas sp. Hart1]|eukprot:CCW69277.1 unnamed protein product [Phytomonas sp. isolate Hart1]